MMLLLNFARSSLSRVSRMRDSSSCHVNDEDHFNFFISFLPRARSYSRSEMKIARFVIKGDYFHIGILQGQSCEKILEY